MPGRVKPNANVSGNCQATDTVSDASQFPESVKMIQRTTNLMARLNQNNRNINRENVDTCRLSNGSRNLNRRSADPRKPVTMGEREQLEVFSMPDISSHFSRKRSYDKLQADLNKVQREILGIVSTPPSAKGQYTNLVLREIVPSSDNSQYCTDSYNINCLSYLNSLTRDLYQTQCQQTTYSQSCDQGLLNAYNNNVVNNSNSFQWQPYAQDNYQRTNHSWSSRTHYRQNSQSQTYYRTSHNY
jgi:hypothetical protein